MFFTDAHQLLKFWLSRQSSLQNNEDKCVGKVLDPSRTLLTFFLDLPSFPKAIEIQSNYFTSFKVMYLDLCQVSKMTGDGREQHGMINWARCVGKCKRPAGSEQGLADLATFSCRVGCKNVRIAVLGSGWQLAFSCLSQWYAMGERTGNGRGEQETTVVGVGGSV